MIVKKGSTLVFVILILQVVEDVLPRHRAKGLFVHGFMPNSMKETQTLIMTSSLFSRRKSCHAKNVQLKISDRSSVGSSSSSNIRRKVMVEARNDGNNNNDVFTQKDIIWKIAPFQGSSVWEQIAWKFSCAVLRLRCLVHGTVEPPLLFFPEGGKIQLEAYYQNEQIGRFGITTECGPPAPPIQETAMELFPDCFEDPTQTKLLTSAAIIYMFVEPDYRSKQLGSLALQVIRYIHAKQGCDVIVLVADDNGSGRLIEWYETVGGFLCAPKLQNLLGSPNAIYGTTMISPTTIHNNHNDGKIPLLPKDCTIQW